jgi:hypothetical protein
MVHATSIIPGLSNFLDNVVLSQFSPTSPKRIIGAGVLSLALKNADTTLYTILQNPMVIGLGIVTENNLIDIDTVKYILKEQISKAGVMRINVPLLGNIDFTSEDVDSLYKYITSAQPVIKEEVSTT